MLFVLLLVVGVDSWWMMWFFLHKWLSVLFVAGCWYWVLVLFVSIDVVCWCYLLVLVLFVGVVCLYCCWC